MGNGMNKIMPGLYIGNFRDAKDMAQITEHGITHIVAIHDNAKPSLERLKYKCVDISDTPGQNISEHFTDCIDFIHDARKKGGNVLVHCIAGVSRSSTICAAYIVVVTKVTWSDAILAVRAARSVVNPNYGFQKQLQLFERLDAQKVRKQLITRYGELNQDDVTHINSALKTVDPSTNHDPHLALGTTPTFGSYERKKGTKE